MVLCCFRLDTMLVFLDIHQLDRKYIMLELKQTQGKASLYRKESYNGRTTAMVEWIVKVGDQVIRYCTTKKEALVWLNLYSN